MASAAVAMPSDFAQRRPQSVKKHAELVASFEERDMHTPARRISKTSCGSTTMSPTSLASASWATSQLSLATASWEAARLQADGYSPFGLSLPLQPTYENNSAVPLVYPMEATLLTMAGEIEGQESRKSSKTKLSSPMMLPLDQSTSPRSSFDSSVCEDNDTAVQLALACLIEEDSDSDADGVDHRDSQQVPFTRVRTNSIVGMPEPESSISDVTLSTFWGPMHAYQALQLQQYGLLGGDASTNNATKDDLQVSTPLPPYSMPLAMLGMRPDALSLMSDVCEISSYEVPATQQSPLHSTMPCSPHSSMPLPRMPHTDGWPFGAPAAPLLMAPTNLGSTTESPAVHSPAMSAMPKCTFPAGGHQLLAQLPKQHGSPQPPAQQRRKRTDAGARRAEAQTTICFRNLPNNYSTKMVLQLLDQNGFKSYYDFVYVPHDFKRLPSLVNVGYFFVNFISHDVAACALENLVGYKSWSLLSTKVLAGSWAARTQGKEACLERCKYFTFMHDDVPEECKPMMFEHGMPIRLEKPSQNGTPSQRNFAR